MDNFSNESMWEDTSTFEDTPAIDPTFTEPEVPEKKGMVFAILSFVFGLVSTFSSCCYGSGFIFAVVSIVFFFVSKSKKEEGDAFSIIGLIASIIALLICLLWVVYIVFILVLSIIGSAASASYGSYY